MAVRRPTINPYNFPRSGPFGAIGPKFPTGSGPYGRDCPALNEEVLLADNKWIHAKDLKVGDEVETHLGSNKVTHIDVLKDRIKKEVVFSNNNKEESIVTSDSHPYFVDNEEGFVEVKDLKVGDQVGNFEVKEIKDADKGSVVHISIDEAQTYYLKAGDEKVLSHNKSIAPPSTPKGPRPPRPPMPTPGMNKKDYYEMLQAQGFEIPTGAIIDPPRGGFPNIPNLQGIANIPGLENFDFSNLPQNMNFSGLPQGLNRIFPGPSTWGQPLPFNPRFDPPRRPIDPINQFDDIGREPVTTNRPIPDAAIDPVVQAPVMPTAPAPVQTTAPTQPITSVQQPLAPYTGGNDPAPYVSNQLRNETGLDALSQQLLFGLGGKGGFIPGAMRAAERTFFDEEGKARVIPQEVADLTPDQLRAMEMARQATGIQDPYLADAQSAFRSSVGELGSGLDRARQRELESLGVIQGGVGSLGRQLSDVENIQRGAVGNFGTQLGSLAGRSIGATDRFGNRLGESEGLLRGTLGGYDPSLTSSFYNPFEDRVVQQTIDDVLEAGEKQDMAQRARDIMTGGESAFGSRARLSADERREALGRGLGQALGSLRSQGFSEAQRTGLGEFARQRAQEMATAQGLSGLAGSRLGAQQNLTSQLSNFAGQQLGAQQGLASNLGALAGTRFGAQQTQAGALSNLGNLEGQIGQQRAQAQQNLGANLQNIGTQAQQAGAFDINQLMGAGQTQQAQQQAQLDAQRMNQLQAQQAPMAQYQSLLPFVQSVPTGSFQTSTTFAPKPSALQSGLGVGLSTLGALGSFFNQPQQRPNAGYTS